MRTHVHDRSAYTSFEEGGPRTGLTLLMVPAFITYSFKILEVFFFFPFSNVLELAGPRAGHVNALVERIFLFYISTALINFFKSPLFCPLLRIRSYFRRILLTILSRSHDLMGLFMVCCICKEG